MAKTRDYKLLDNLRFYILTSSLLLSAAVVSWLRLQIPSDQLFYIRAQQLFGLLCLIYWYVALLISPLGYVIGKQRIKYLEFGRRAIGVSAFYFGFLHMAIALWGQLGGPGQLGSLPPLFKWSLLGGAIGLAILTLMAATSFDKVVDYLTFRHWKWLHRLVYLAGVLVILHVWTIGTHLVYQKLQWGAFAALAVLAALELYRVTVIVNRKYLKLPRSYAAIMWLAGWVIVVSLIFFLPSIVTNYHGQHQDSGQFQTEHQH